MTFISENLLLNLPLFGEKEGLWRDESGNELHATPNKYCKQTTLSKLGSCIHLDTGGEIRLARKNSVAVESIDIRNNLTLEFWALPDESDSTESTWRTLLSGPIYVGMNKTDLMCDLSGEYITVPLQPPESENSEASDATKLHHWAIVISRAAAEKSSTAFTIYRNGVLYGSKDIGTASVTNSEAFDMQKLVIGSDDEGTSWVGTLAHLRVWGIALDEKALKKNIARDVTAHAAFKAGTVLDWRLVNNFDEPSLYIHGSQQQMLYLELLNVANTMDLIIPKGEGEVSKDNWHFQLVFRPGTLAKHTIEEKFVTDFENLNKNEKRDGTPGAWQVSKSINDTDSKDFGGEVYLSFLWVSDTGFTLGNGQILKLYLPGIAAEPGAGSRTTRVALSYKQIGLNLKSGENSRLDLDGHRAQLLNIIYRDPLISYRKPPLEVGVLGAPVVLNNGEQTSLMLYIKNLKRDEDGNAAPLLLGALGNSIDTGPKFILEIDANDKSESLGEILGIGLGDPDDLKGIDIRDAREITVKGSEVELVFLEEGGYMKINEAEGGWTHIALDGFMLGVYTEVKREELKVTLNDKMTNQQAFIDLNPVSPFVKFPHGEPVNIRAAFAHGREKEWASQYQSPITINAWELDAAQKTVRSRIHLTQQVEGNQVGFAKGDTILLTLENLKTTAPPGRSVLRLRYEDFEAYGEGVFEIPIEKSTCCTS